KIECFIDRGCDACQQGAPRRHPLVACLLLENRPCPHSAQSDGRDNKSAFPNPQMLEPLEKRGGSVEAGFLQSLAFRNQVFGALVHQTLLGICTPKIFCHSSPASST